MNYFIESIKKYRFNIDSFNSYYVGYLNHAIKNGLSNKELNEIVELYENAIAYLKECK